MTKRTFESDDSPNKRATSLISSLRVNRMTPSGYQKVDAIDTLFHALRTSDLTLAVQCAQELECGDVWTSLFSFCTRESPNSLKPTLQWFDKFQNNRPFNQILAAQDLGNAVSELCSAKHDTEPFCALLQTSLLPPVQMPTQTSPAFVQLRDLVTFEHTAPFSEGKILNHFWAAFSSMDPIQCAISILALFDLQDCDEGETCVRFGHDRSSMARTKRIIQHWFSRHLSKSFPRHLAKNPLSYLYLLMSACMAQEEFQKAHNITVECHETAHLFLLDAVGTLAIPNRVDPVQLCIGVCCAIFNVFKGSPPRPVAPASIPIIVNCWTDNVQEVVARRKFSVHRQLRHTRPLELSVPILAAALTPEQINMSHDLSQKYTNLVFFDEMAGHCAESVQECRNVYKRAIRSQNFTFDVRKPYIVCRFLVTEAQETFLSIYSK